jgi:plastocyanin
MPAFRPRIPAFRAAVALGLAAGLASTLSLFAPPPLRGAEHAVQIADSAFSPATLTITAGDTVTWRNADDRPHTVTSNDGAFDSGNLDEGVGFSFTFTEPGTYTYRCDYHPDMQATIVVVAAGGAAPETTSSGTTESSTGGTDASATGGDSSTTGVTNAAPTHTTGGQPNTALEAPISMAWLSPLLIGLGLVALAFGLVPPASEPRPARVMRPSGGWRR